jgi:glutaredoxin-like protein NrdH
MTTSPMTVVWTNPGCPPCNLTKAALKKRGVPFEVKNLQDHPDRLASFKARGLMSAPIVEPFCGTPWAGLNLDRINDLEDRFNAYAARPSAA